MGGKAIKHGGEGEEESWRVCLLCVVVLRLCVLVWEGAGEVFIAVSLRGQSPHKQKTSAVTEEVLITVRTLPTPLDCPPSCGATWPRVAQGTAARFTSTSFSFSCER